MPPPTGPDREQEEAEPLLFTGFPGFIGLRLLPRILELRPRARVRCLVQEKFLEPAGAAVKAIAEDHPHTEGRLGLVRGDITRPGLGLDPGPARELTGRLREAYHLAAVYDLAVSQEVGHRINVEGTRNVLDFLQEAPRFSRLHYVSTAYVSGRAKGLFRESDLDVGQGFKNHYEETKFQAEVEVVRSRVPRTIYRPGAVGAVARLSAAPLSEGKTYHLTDPRPHSARELSEIFARALGKQFVYLPVPLGLARLLFRPRVVQRFFGMPVEALEYFDDDVRHDATQATTDLEALGVRCPPLEEYVPRLVAFYRSRRDTVRREAMI